MRILFAVHGYKPAFRVGGPIISVSSLAEAMVKRGHHVTVFTTNFNLDEDLDVPTNRPVDVEGVQVWYFQRREYINRALPFVPYFSKSMGFLYAPAMARELSRLTPTVDVVHTHIPFVYPTLAAARSAFKYRKPLFYHQRGVFDPERLRFKGAKKALYIAAVERPIMNRATALIALTEAEVASYRALGVTTPCRVLPNGVDCGAYRTKPKEPRPLGIDPDSLVVLFLGRIHPTKGADRLLTAFFSIAARVPTAVLVLAGPDEYGLEEKMRQRVEMNGLSGRVLFPGMISGSLKLDLLARADLFCLPSDAEGFSMAVLEALASGTPVMLSPGCHFPEVERAGAGWTVARDPRVMTEALSSILSNQGALSAAARTARHYAASAFSWNTITERMLDLYEESLQSCRVLGS